MKKILKIRFTKFERALAMQVLEQEGLPEEKEDGFVRIARWPEIRCDAIYLRGGSVRFDWDVARCTFKSNDERDHYFDKAVKAITEELFTDEARELEIGKECEVSDDKVQWRKRILIAIIPEEFGVKDRYIAKSDEVFPPFSVAWRYARPLGGRVEPIVELLSDGDAVYTWESGVGK